MAEGDTKAVTLGPNNLIQVGTLVTVVAAVFGGTLWLARTDNRLSNLETSVEEIRGRYDGYVTDSTFDLWVDLLEARNPQLAVPKLR